MDFSGLGESSTSLLFLRLSYLVKSGVSFTIDYGKMKHILCLYIYIFIHCLFTNY